MQPSSNERQGESYHMAKAVIYARYSSHSQREESIEDQVRVCEKAAREAGDEIVRVYSDKAVSGTTDRRDEFLRMVDDSERGGWEKVYVYKTDRFARNRFDSAIYKSKLKKNGARVVAAAEHIPEGADGILLESVLEGMAEYYSANLAQNIKRGMDGNAERCHWNGVPVYGYDPGPDGRYVVNPVEAEVVRTMFRMAADGSPLADICRAVKPHRTRKGNDFSVAVVSKMLRKEKYVGVYEFSGFRKEGGMPAIVDRNTFLRVQRRLDSHTRKPRDERAVYALTGKVYDDAGNRYRGNSGRSETGRKYTYYRCQETGATIPQDVLEAAVADAVAEAVRDDATVDVIVDLVLAAQEAAETGERDEAAALERRLKDNGRERDKLIDFAMKVGSDDKMAARMEELRREAGELEVELREVAKGAPVLERDHVVFWLQELRKEKDPRKLVDSFVSRVVISADYVLVEFNIAENPRSNGEFCGFPVVEARRIELRSILPSP